MKILVEIDTDNAAFQGVLHLEISRLLRVCSAKAQNASNTPFGIRVGWEQKLQDSNGNTVGFIKAVHHSEESK